MLAVGLPPVVIDQQLGQLPHRPATEAVEVLQGVALPLAAEEFGEVVVHEGGRAEGVPWPLPAHEVPGGLVQGPIQTVDEGGRSRVHGSLLGSSYCEIRGRRS